MSQSAEELRAIFNLFEGGTGEEMDIRTVNQVMRQIEELHGKPGESK